MIATLSEIKRIINISQSDTSKDENIKLLMLICEEEIHDICINNFIRSIDILNEKYLGINTLSFDSTTNKISDSNNQLDKFSVGNTIKIFNSVENDGIYLIDEVAGDGSYIIVDDDYIELIDESAATDKYISIYKLWYPKSLKFAISSMINYRLSNDAEKISGGIKSEKIDDYSITYSSEIKTGLSGYTESILKMLQPHRKYYR